MPKRAKPNPAELRQILNAAILAHQRGQLDRAESGYKAVLKALPDQPEALNLLGLIEHLKGRNARAVQLLRKSIKSRPDFADAYNHLGIALRKMGQLDEAKIALRKAISIDPDHAQANNNLGNVYKELGQHSDAAQCYERAVLLGPKSVEPKYNLANSLTELERHSEAMDKFREVIAIAPNHLDARFNLAALLERHHELDVADQQLEVLLRLKPGHIAGRILRAKIWRRLNKFQDAVDVLQAVSGNDVSTQDAIIVSVELGKCLDRLEKSEVAFEKFRQANLLQAEAGGKRLKKQARAFRQSIEDNLAWLEDHVPDLNVLPDGEGSSEPVFLVGFPRSGTTLLDQVLDAHPAVKVMEERPVIANMVANFAGNNKTAGQAIDRVDDETVRQLRKEYFERVASYFDLEPGDILVDKMPLNIIHVPFLEKVFPGARYIFSLRHPVDVLLSNYMQLYRLNGAMANFLDLDDACQTYDLVMRLWCKCREKYALNVHQVRYENLVGQLEIEAKSIAKFLGLEWAEPMLDPTSHAKNRAIINTPSYEQVAEPIYQRANGRWKRYANQLAPIVDRLGPWAVQFDYEM